MVLWVKTWTFETKEKDKNWCFYLYWDPKVDHICVFLTVVDGVDVVSPPLWGHVASPVRRQRLSEVLRWKLTQRRRPLFYRGNVMLVIIEFLQKWARIMKWLQLFSITWIPALIQRTSSENYYYSIPSILVSRQRNCSQSKDVLVQRKNKKATKTLNPQHTEEQNPEFQIEKKGMEN